MTRRGGKERFDGSGLLVGTGAFFFGMTIAGVVMVAWGATLAGTGANVLLSVGGAILGTSFAALVSSRSEQRFLEEVRAIIGDSLAPGLTTRDEELNGHRVTYFHYVLTRKDGESLWTANQLDFSSSHTVGRLTATSVVSTGSKKLKYIASAGMVDERFVIVEKADGGSKEPAAIYVYPELGHAYRDLQAGVAILHDHDGRELLTQCIISSDPLVDVDKEVFDMHTEEGKALSASWSKHAPDMQPGVIDPDLGRERSGGLAK